METLRRKPNEATAPLHQQLSRDEDGDGGPPSLTVYITNNRTWSWVRPLDVLKLRLLALVLVLKEEQVESDELELKHEGEVDEADSPNSSNSDLTPSLAPNDSNSDLTAPVCAHNPPRSPRST